MDNKLKKTSNETFGEYIKRLRLLREYTQRKLAQLSNISNTTISRIEKGGEAGIENPDIDTVVSLSKGLNVHKELLLLAAGYLDEKETPYEATDIKDILRHSLEKLGWVNSQEEINEETLIYIEFLLKNYGNKNKQIP